MPDVLVDTSIWIDVLRGKDPEIQGRVAILLRRERAVLCGIVEMELLHGMRRLERETLQELFSPLPYLEVDRNDWQAAGDLLSSLRSQGINIPATDALIGTLCIRYGLSLLTKDKHFQSIPRLEMFKE